MPRPGLQRRVRSVWSTVRPDPRAAFYLGALIRPPGWSRAPHTDVMRSRTTDE